MNKSLLAFLILFVSFTSCEVIGNEKCKKGPDSRNIRSEVHEIRVTPCPEAEEDEPCKLYKGSNATIEVDFTPTIGARRPKAGMFWMSRIDMVFRGMKPNACQGMPCPINSGTRYTYSTTIPLGKELPAGNYPIKIKVYERRNMLFCQELRIKLLDAEE